MAKVFEGIDDALKGWIERQALFFTGTAPLARDGHVNVSPKGPIGSLRILSSHRVAYLDVVGSSAETIAHLRENGRIVLMFCAFDGPPRIVRLHGRGEVVLAGDPRFPALLAESGFAEPAERARERAIVVVDVTRVADSCGYGVPLMRYAGEREQGEKWAANLLRRDGPNALRQYQAQQNAASIDGLPAIEPVPA